MLKKSLLTLTWLCKKKGFFQKSQVSIRCPDCQSKLWVHKFTGTVETSHSYKQLLLWALKAKPLVDILPHTSHIHPVSRMAAVRAQDSIVQLFNHRQCLPWGLIPAPLAWVHAVCNVPTSTRTKLNWHMFIFQRISLYLPLFLLQPFTITRYSGLLEVCDLHISTNIRGLRLYSRVEECQNLWDSFLYLQHGVPVKGHSWLSESFWSFKQESGFVVKN